MTSSSAVCLESSRFFMYCAVLSHPLWRRCPSFCFTATGYSIGFGQWYRRYCGICISFPQSPVGQPGAVYLSGYKAASQRAKGKGNGTEVSVRGTGCHCVFQQGCEICKCLRYSWRRLQKSKGCLRFMNAGMHVRVFTSTPPYAFVHTAHTYTHANVNVNVLTLLPNLFPFTLPSFWTDLFSLRHFIYLAKTCALWNRPLSHLFSLSWPCTHKHTDKPAWTHPMHSGYSTALLQCGLSSDVFLRPLVCLVIICVCMCVFMRLCVCVCWMRKHLFFFLTVITVDVRDVCCAIKIQEKSKDCLWDHQSAGRVSPACLQTVCRCCFVVFHKRKQERKRGRERRREGRRRTWERQISKDWDRRREKGGEPPALH